MRVFVFCAVMALAAATPSGAQPLTIHNFSPVWFGLLFPAPDSPAAAGEGEWKTTLSADYSSIFLQDEEAGWKYYFDMELAQITLQARRGLAQGLEIGGELPAYYAGGGFLDSFILDYHRTFGFPDYIGQRAAPRNRYLYYVDHNGVRWNDLRPYQVSLGETVFWVKKELNSGLTDGTAVKLFLQAPTASAKNGIGSASWQYAAFFIASEKKGNGEGTLNAGVAVPGHISREENFPLNPYLMLDFSAQYQLSRRFAPVAQLTYSSSPYGADAPELWRRFWLALSVGAHWTLENGKTMELSFTEDLSFTAPDFTIHFLYPF